LILIEPKGWPLKVQSLLSFDFNHYTDNNARYTVPKGKSDNKMDKIIIAFISGALVAMISSYIAHIFSERRDRRKEFNDAAAKFQNAFIDVKVFLEFGAIGRNSPIVTDNVNEFLGTYRIEHLKAVVEFKAFLNKRERRRIEKAWNEYCHPEEVPKDKYERRDFTFNGYFHIQETRGKEAAKGIALEKINGILKFAQFS